MNTAYSEKEDNLTVAINYYNAMLSKNFETMASYLSNGVHFVGPLAEMHGKDEVLCAAKNLAGMLQDIQIRSRFAGNNQIMLTYDMMFSGDISKLRAAVLMDFKSGQIAKIELFYDGRPFEAKKDEIFTNTTN